MSVDRSLSVGNSIARSALRNPNKIALVAEDERYTYLELDRYSNRVANAMLDLGVNRGAKIAVLCSNRPEWVVIHYGVAKIGAIMVPLNTRIKGEEFTYILEDSKAEMLIFEDGYLEVVLSNRHNFTQVKNYICIGKSEERNILSYSGFIFSHPDTSPTITVSEEDPCNIFYTSGTTGRPKGAMITHKNRLYINFAVIIEFSIETEDTVLITGPLFHSGPIYLNLHPVLTMGGTAVLLKKFDPEQTLYLFGKERVTKLGLVPTMLHSLLGAEGLDKYDLSSLRKLNYGGSAIPRNLLEKTLNYFKNLSITQSYGLTECGILTILRPDEQIRKYGCTGRPLLFTEVSVWDEEKSQVGFEGSGEIVTRGPHVMKGYLNKPKETEESFKNGWFHTGDIATVEEDGFLTITDRKADLIISGGENIYPKEIEDVLNMHPAVSESAVFGIPDEKWGESVCAAIVLKPDMSLSESQIIDYCRERMASFKKPKKVELVGILPKNEIGKVLKGDLKKKYWKNAGRKI